MLSGSLEKAFFGTNIQMPNKNQNIFICLLAPLKTYFARTFDGCTKPCTSALFFRFSLCHHVCRQSGDPTFSPLRNTGARTSSTTLTTSGCCWTTTSFTPGACVPCWFCVPFGTQMLATKRAENFNTNQHVLWLLFAGNILCPQTQGQVRWTRRHFVLLLLLSPLSYL